MYELETVLLPVPIQSVISCTKSASVSSHSVTDFQSEVGFSLFPLGHSFSVRSRLQFSGNFFPFSQSAPVRSGLE